MGKEKEKDVNLVSELFFFHFFNKKLYSGYMNQFSREMIELSGYMGVFSLIHIYCSF